jgi:hypothetical protein
MTKPIVTFCNFANAPKKDKILHKLYICPPPTVYRNIRGKTVHVIDYEKMKVQLHSFSISEHKS